MITAQIERFELCLPELAAIFPDHWEELGLFRQSMPLAPQYHEYVRREQAGALFLATVRWDGRIVGYYVAQVQPGFHYERTLTATQDMVYVLPEFRNHGLALPLFRRVEKELRRRGAQIWYAGWKTHSPLGMDRLLGMFGFIPADTYVAKWLGD